MWTQIVSRKLSSYDDENKVIMNKDETTNVLGIKVITNKDAKLLYQD